MILEFNKQGFNFMVDVADVPVVGEKSFYLKINKFTINGNEINLGKYKDYGIDYFTRYGKVINNKREEERLLCINTFGITCQQISEILNLKRKDKNEPLKIIIDGDSKKKVEALFEIGEKMLVEAKKKKEEEIREADKKINDDDMVYIQYGASYYVSIDGAIKDSFVVKDIKNKLNKFKDNGGNYDDLLGEYFTEFDIGDYIITNFFKLPYSEINTIFDKIDKHIEMVARNKAEAAAKREARKQALVDKARLTGEPQLYDKWSEPCNDRNEECNVDIVHKYIDENGDFSIIRHHTW